MERWGRHAVRPWLCRCGRTHATLRFVSRPSQQAKIASHLLAQYDLQCKAQSLELLLALLNLCHLMPTIVNASPMSSRGEFATVQRSGNVVLRMNSSSVEQQFLTNDSGRTNRLSHVSRGLNQVNIPNIYGLLKVEQKVAVFERRGILEQPQTISELFTALLNVLEASVVLHSCSRMHCDILWPNVMKLVNGTGWFLIEFDSIVSSPQRSESVPEHLCTDEHAPEMSSHEHTEAVDIWSVGSLIMSSAVPWEERRCLFSFAQWLMRDRYFDRPEATEVLAKLLELEKSETAKTQERKTDKSALAWF